VAYILHATGRAVRFGLEVDPEKIHYREFGIFASSINSMLKKIRENELKLDLAVEASRTVIWEWDVEDDSTWFDNNFFRLTGLTLEDNRIYGDNWYKYISPEDREKNDAEFENIMSGKTAVYESEFRFIKADGETLWVLSRGKITSRGADGRPVKMAGTFTNIDSIKKTQQKLNAALEEKEVLFREMNHRIKNNLAIITGLISLEASEIKEEKTRKMLLELKTRIHMISLIHQKLCYSDRVTDINLKEFIYEIIYTLQADAAKVKYEINVPDYNMPVKKAVTLGLILNELVTNSIKYAFRGSEKNIIFIKVKIEEDMLNLELGDNGIGLKDNEEHSGAMGLKLVYALLHQLDAEVGKTIDRGTVWTIKFRPGSQTEL
jgi:PAS domain S-box-containing protein